jgi:hypothetical protein
MKDVIFVISFLLFWGFWPFAYWGIVALIEKITKKDLTGNSHADELPY